MSVPEYSAGGWTAVVRPGFVALLGPTTATSTVRALWQDAGEGVFSALALLARDGFGGLPPFAVVSVDGQRVHAALRGDVEVVVEVGGRRDVWRSGEVSTWTERVLEGVSDVAVQVESPAAGAVSLPLADGVVQASRVSVALTAREEAVAPVVAAEPEPVQVSEPEPEPEAVDEPSADPVAEPTPALVEHVVWDEPTTVELVPVELAPVEAQPASEVEVEIGDVAEDADLGEDSDASEVVAVAESFLAWPAVVPAAAEVAEAPTSELPVAAVPLTGASLDDHDGLTILSTDLAEIREQLPSWASDEVPGPFRVPAAVQTAARLVLSTGLVVPLDRAVLLGRAPQVARVTNRELPRLITVPSPQQDISRTHAEVRVEGDHVVVTDLDSTNGVHVARPGEGARRLHPGEPSVVGVDEVVDLGDGVTFSVERGS
ncbi:FHA domain-containing protein [Cellulomonas sp. ICMP 17802]|uniref:FHA domain-containing protein n=1 Tax=Cellulomonas sp. ICMP 17802 TaxID=3239199 RepID=UPI00351BAA03